MKGYRVNISSRCTYRNLVNTILIIISTILGLFLISSYLQKANDNHNSIISSVNDHIFSLNKVKQKSCKQFAVTTLCHGTTEVLKNLQRIVSLPKWCIVVVGDKVPRARYTKSLTQKDNVFFLSPKYQKRYAGGYFRNLSTFHCLARKNVGFLFAIRSGARIIFDFDANIVLKPLSDGVTTPHPFFYKESMDSSVYMSKSMLVRFEGANSTSSSSRFFNPYPHMGASINPSWPRGFPLDELESTNRSIISMKINVGDIPFGNIGVIQSMCDRVCDNDAVYRMTFPNADKLRFKKNPNITPFLIPHNRYTPYNAQATTHLYSSFWGLYLPTTVPERVSDIWRSYITQRIMKEIGLYLVYTPPKISQNRIFPQPSKLMGEELELYQKTTSLIKFLDEWESSALFLSERIYNLYSRLYENGFIGQRDVEAVNEWLRALSEIGYSFPTFPIKTNKLGEQASNGARLQPSLGGQPYRAHPYYKFTPLLQNLEGKTYADMDKHEKQDMKKWMSTIDIKMRPDRSIIKLIMMTMDEWPLLESWTLFHGELVGFENLYIIDGSKDTRCISFLVYARDILGANVIFSHANLNELQALMSQIAAQIAGSSDFILKVDTDEFLSVYDEKTGTIRSSLFEQYLNELRKYTNSTESLRIGYWQRTLASKELCIEGKDLNIFDMPVTKLTKAPNDYKCLFNSNGVFQTGISLGGHAHDLPPDAATTNLAILHCHTKCFKDEIENSRKACISHNFISDADTNEEAIKKLTELLGLRPENGTMCGVTPTKKMVSIHKAIFYVQYLKCPEKMEAHFYSGMQKGIERRKMNDFGDYLKMAKEKYKSLLV